MGGANSWRQIQDGPDWMREVEKRILHEERRPGVRTASDLLGPGIAPFSIPITDWNGSETSFNGFFHSEPGALHTPDSTGYWMGINQATVDGSGIQRVVEYQGGQFPGVVWIRRFSTPPGVSRIFTAWVREDGNDTGWLNMENWLAGFGPAGGPDMWQARQIGNKVELRGNITNATFTGTNVTVCTLDPEITRPPIVSAFAVVGSTAARWGTVLSGGQLQLTAATASSGWFQIVGSYLTD